VKKNYKFSLLSLLIYYHNPKLGYYCNFFSKHLYKSNLFIRNLKIIINLPSVIMHNITSLKPQLLLNQKTETVD